MSRDSQIKKIELTATHYLCCNKYFFICAISPDCHTIRSEKGFGIEKKMVILCSQIDTLYVVKNNMQS